MPQEIFINDILETLVNTLTATNVHWLGMQFRKL